VRFGLLVKMMIGGVTGWLIAQSRYQALQLHHLIPLLDNPVVNFRRERWQGPDGQVITPHCLPASMVTWRTAWLGDEDLLCKRNKTGGCQSAWALARMICEPRRPDMRGKRG
jgi:hypothetical protein